MTKDDILVLHGVKWIDAGGMKHWTDLQSKGEFQAYHFEWGSPPYACIITRHLRVVYRAVGSIT